MDRARLLPWNRIEQNSSTFVYQHGAASQRANEAENCNPSHITPRCHSVVTIRRDIGQCSIADIDDVMEPSGGFISNSDAGSINISTQFPPNPQRTAQFRRELHAMVSRWQPLLKIFEYDLMLKPFSLWATLYRCAGYLPQLLRNSNLKQELRESFSDPAAQDALGGSLLYNTLTPGKNTSLSVLY